MQQIDTIYNMLTYSIISTLICMSIILIYKSLYKRGKHFSVADVMTCSIVVLLSGFRYNVGSDYERYMKSAMYAITKFSDLKVLFTKQTLEQYSYQIGFQFISVIGSYICKSHYTIFWVVSLIIYPAIFYYGRKYTRNSLFAVSVFLLFGFWGFSLNALKQSISIVFILYSYIFLRKRNYFKFIICSLLAVSFHSSSIIAIIGVLVANSGIVKIKKRTLWQFIGIGVILRFVFPMISGILSRIPLLNKYLTYLSQDYSNRIDRSFIWIGNFIEVLFVCIIIYIAIIFKDTLEERNMEADTIICLVMFGIPLGIVGISRTLWLSSRLALDFFAFLIVLWPLLMDNNTSNKIIHGHTNEGYLLNAKMRSLLWMGLFVWHMLYSVLMVDNSTYTIQTYLFK